MRELPPTEIGPELDDRRRPSGHGRIRRLPDGVRNLVHLVVLTSFAIAQPAFGVLKPEFFIAHGAAQVDVVAVALLLTFALPAVLILIELAAAQLSERVAWMLHLAFVTGLFAIFASDLARQGGLTNSRQGLVALLAGLAATTLYVRVRPVRSVLTVLAPAPVLLLALFLLSAPMSNLTLRGEGGIPVSKVHSKTPVVVLALDEVSATSLMNANRQIDAVRYPNFARLARGSSWFRHATTSNSETFWAVPSILSGSRGSSEDVATAADHPRNLFTFLGGSYRLNVSDPWTDLCPERLCPNTSRRSFVRRTASLFKDVSLVSLVRWAPQRLRNHFPRPSLGETADPPAQFSSFTSSMAGGDRPTLNYLHILLPHIPWVYLPSGRRYSAPAEGAAELQRSDGWGDDSALVTQGYVRHLLQLGYTDRLLGRLLRRLRAKGVYDKALVVVTADHGVSFRPGQPRRAVSRTNAEDILSVPLFVKRPGQRHGKVSDRYVKTIDILPTIADVIGAPLPRRTDGESVFRQAQRGRLSILDDESSHRYVLSSSEFTKRQDTAVRRKARLFGSPLEVSSLLRAGPDPALVGRRIGPVSRGTGTITLRDRARFRSVDPSSSTAPVTVEGELGNVGTRQEVAIGLNGRIVSTTRTFTSWSGKTKLFVAVPPSALRPGDNRVELYTVAVKRGHRSLQALKLNG